MRLFSLFRLNRPVPIDESRIIRTFGGMGTVPIAQVRP